MRVIGLDEHRSMAVIAILENGHLNSGGRVDLTRDAVIAFGRKLRFDDEVVIEATVNTATIVRLLRPFARRVVIANPLQVRAIAHAKIKTDKIDATVLTKLHASGFLPEVWMPDEATETLRHRVAQRAQVVQQMTRIKAVFTACCSTRRTPRTSIADPACAMLRRASGRSMLT